MNTLTNPVPANTQEVDFKKLLNDYKQADFKRSLWQVVNSFVPYFAILIAMYFTLNISYWLTLVLAVPAAGFMIRIFIISHDCGHGSFFKSRRAREITGFISGLIAFVPYHQWRHSHALHHATSGDLDRRGLGDVWTLTVNEYLELPFLKRLGYRLYRNPLIMFGLGPIYVFLVGQRFPQKGAKKRERNSVLFTNLALLSIVLVSAFTIGIKTYLLIQMPVLIFAATAGVWLFYVQHQYEDVYWEHSASWDFQAAALQGSSYYQLPAILRWFSGNIGFHHIHHLNSRIPNYYLKRCHQILTRHIDIKPITFFKSFKSLNCRLWDENNAKLVGFGYLKRLAVN